MGRWAGLGLLAALWAGCSDCPPANCTPWFVLTLRSDDWPLGQVLVEVEGGAFRHVCEGDVLTPGAAPFVRNTHCEGFATVGGGLQDTGFSDATAWSLKKAAFGRPERMQVRLWTRDQEEGPWVLWQDEEIVVPWETRDPWTETCQPDCWRALATLTF